MVATQRCFGKFSPRILKENDDPSWRFAYFSDGVAQPPQVDSFSLIWGETLLSINSSSRRTCGYQATCTTKQTYGLKSARTFKRGWERDMASWFGGIVWDGLGWPFLGCNTSSRMPMVGNVGNLVHQKTHLARQSKRSRQQKTPTWSMVDFTFHFLSSIVITGLIFSHTFWRALLWSVYVEIAEARHFLLWLMTCKRCLLWDIRPRKLTAGTWKSPPLNSENIFQNFMTLGSTSSFFQVTLWSPKWRSLNPWKGHLTHPNRSLGRTWILIFRGLFFVSTGHCRSRFVSSPPWKPVRWTDLSPKSQHPRVQRAQPLGVLCCLFCRWWCQIFLFSPLLGEDSHFD